MVLQILSPDKVIFNGEVDKVTVPGAKGRFTVLQGHAPLISLLSKGEILYSQNGTEQTLEIAEGIAEVKNNKIVVCIYGLL